MSLLVNRCTCVLNRSVRFRSSLTQDSDSKKSKIKHDLIGPPDKTSNLRPIHFYHPPNETALQKEYRELRIYAQDWNQKFWNNHNTNYTKEREEYMATTKKVGESTLSADEMSVFYKSFLDKNWQTHTEYNIEWYKINIKIFTLAVSVGIEKIINKLK